RVHRPRHALLNESPTRIGGSADPPRRGPVLRSRWGVVLSCPARPFPVAVDRGSGAPRGSGVEGPQLDVLEPAGRAVVLQADVTVAGVVLVDNVELVGRAVRATVHGRPGVEGHRG